MARNETITLTGDMLDRSTFYAGIVSRVNNDSEIISFQYDGRNGNKEMRTVTEVIEIVGEAGMSTHGFKGMTERGPRTFNFHLMG